MFRTIRWFGYFWFSLLSYYPDYLRVKNKEIQTQRNAAFKKAKHWSSSLLNIAGTTLIIEGEAHIPQDEDVLVIANHQSNFDIPIMISLLKRPSGFIAKMELSKMPFVSGWMKALGCVFMDRSDIRKQVKAIGEGAKLLEGGHTLVLFPEGTRSKTGSLGEFKAGGLKLATRSKVRVLPISIQGSIDIMQRDSLKINPAEVRIVVHPPVTIESKDTTVEMDKIKKIIEEGMKK